MKLKMFGKKSFSTILYYGTRLITIGYGIFFLFIIVALLTNNFVVTQANDLQIKIPFTNAIIKGDYNINTLIGVLSFSIFYAVFFFLLSLIFKTFSAEKLFTEEAIKHLKWFTVLNLILPIIFTLIAFILHLNITLDSITPILLHIGLGIFSWFIAAIFKLGFTIQEENELTI